MKYKSFHPGQPWLDTNGKRIHAHGGSIFYENGRYYWYGENKEKTTGLDSIWHWGIRCYVSGDLYNWDDLGLIIPPEPDDPASTLHPSKCVDRPHILYNRKTGKYVCWLKVMSVGCTVLTADALLGPYTVVHEGLWPLGMEPGDFDLAVAPDGKAYYFFERVHSELICADLTDDYTNVTGYYSTHFPRLGPPYTREAPAHFIRKGKHYLLTSVRPGTSRTPRNLQLPIPGTVRTAFWAIRIRRMIRARHFIHRFPPCSGSRAKKTSILHSPIAGCHRECRFPMKNTVFSLNAGSAVTRMPFIRRSSRKKRWISASKTPYLPTTSGCRFDLTERWPILTGWTSGNLKTMNRLHSLHF